MRIRSDLPRRARSAVEEGWGAVSDLVLPRTCAGCAEPGASLCSRCAGLLARPELAQPRRPPPGFPPTVAAGRYAGPVRPVVVAFKEHGRAELAGPLGAALALAVAALVTVAGDRPGPGRCRPGVGAGAGVVLVPVPSTAAARRARGREHVRELADRAVPHLREAGVPARVLPLVHRRGRARDSAGLSAAERRANLRGAFVLVPPRRPLPAGSLVVLVDDVVTSGATLAECAGVLAGVLPGRAPPVLAAVVAATPRAPAPRPSGSSDLVVTLRE